MQDKPVNHYLLFRERNGIDAGLLLGVFSKEQKARDFASAWTRRNPGQVRIIEIQFDPPTWKPPGEVMDYRKTA